MDTKAIPAGWRSWRWTACCGFLLTVSAEAIPPERTWPDSTDRTDLSEAPPQLERHPRTLEARVDAPTARTSNVGGDDCHTATVVPVTVGPAGNPNVVTINGDSSAATGPECDAGLFTSWWEAFQIDACANVTIDFCGTTPVLRPNFVVLYTTCAPDGSFCGNFFRADSFSRGICGDDNLTMIFDALPAGTYYYPIIADPDVLTNPPGPYVMNIEAEACTGACTGCLGACCDRGSEQCSEAVAQEDCTGPDAAWSARKPCCEVECRDPAEAAFAAENVELLSRVTIEDFASFRSTPGEPHTANDVWGYDSPSGREYAIVGFTTGTGFVEVTDPTSPQIVGYVDGGVDEIWRDMKTFGTYAYVVSDGGGVGLQVIDLSDIDAGTVSLVNTTDLGKGFQTAHNVAINPASGFLYLCAPNLNSFRGLTVVDLSDPVDPQFAGFWTDATPNLECHDAQIVTYTSGPHAGREIAFCYAGFDGIRIVDVTDKSNMFRISALTYPTIGFCHQGWLTEDRRHVVFNDELDEFRGNVAGTTTYVADVSDLSAPFLAATFTFPSCNIDHNLMVRGQFAFEANYSTGLQVLDLTIPTFPRRSAFFDTRPEDNVQDFVGAWGVYSDLPSGSVLLSDIQRGLFVLRHTPPPPPPGAIPVASGAGLVLMGLLALVLGSLVIAYRRRRDAGSVG